jgi:xylulokinase
MLTVGIDSGTQSTKVVVFDTDAGRIIASAQESYGFIGGLPPGHFEQDPETWVEALHKAAGACFAQLGDQRSEIRAMAVSAQQHGLVVLDKRDAPLRPAKLWCDTSTVAEANEIEAEFGGSKELIRATGNRVLPGYTAPKLLWLRRHEPKNFQSINCILLPHNYLNFWLTGEKCMEFGDASGTGFLDVRTRRWHEPLLRFLGDDLHEHIPQPESSNKVVGLLREEVRRAWGLPTGVIVASGSGDNMMGAIGTGNVAPGVLTVSLGTSGTLYAFAREPVVDERGEVAAFCDATDHWLPLVCTMNVTVATEQVRKLFNWNLDAFEHAVASVAPGAGGLLMLPYLHGERTPNYPSATGVLHGLTPGNFQPAELARAAVEGATLGLGYGLDRLRELGIAPDEVRLTGGGSQSGSWRQIAANVFGLPTVTLGSPEGAAFGAAIQAAFAWEMVQGSGVRLRELTDRWVRLDETSRVEPDDEAVELYKTLRTRQSDLAHRLHTAGHL